MRAMGVTSRGRSGDAPQTVCGLRMPVDDRVHQGRAHGDPTCHAGRRRPAGDGRPQPRGELAGFAGHVPSREGLGTLRGFPTTTVHTWPRSVSRPLVEESLPGHGHEECSDYGFAGTNSLSSQARRSPFSTRAPVARARARSGMPATTAVSGSSTTAVPPAA